MYLEWDLEKLIRLQDEDEYYGLLKQLLKKGYDVDTIKKELSKHKKKVGGLNLEEMNVDNNVLYRLTKNNYGEMTRQIVMPNSYKHQALKLTHSMLPAGHGDVQIILVISYLMSKVFILDWYEKGC